MGYKSRGNFPVNACLKFDCWYRDEHCDECVKFSHYTTCKHEWIKRNSDSGVYEKCLICGIKRTLEGEIL